MFIELARRDKIQIYHDILSYCEKERRLTYILRYANVQYTSFNEAIKIFEDRKLIIKYLKMAVDSKQPKMFYKTTKKGLRLVDDIKKIYKIILV